MAKNNFSNNLNKIRKLKGMSQEDLSKLTGLSKRIIAYYEKESTNDFIDKLIKISRALKVSISTLIGEEKVKIEKNIYDSIENIDVRLLKKLKKIQELPIEDQKAINNYLDMIIERNILKQKQKNIN